jgi:hypothetical protein
MPFPWLIEYHENLHPMRSYGIGEATQFCKALSLELNMRIHINHSAKPSERSPFIYFEVYVMS